MSPESKLVNKSVLEDLRRKQKKRRIIFYVCIAAVIVLILVIILSKAGVFKKKEKDNFKTSEPTVERIPFTPEGYYCFGTAGDTVIVYDENGVTGIDTKGNWKWNVSCFAASPVISSCGDVMLITDQGGDNVWAFSKDGLLWRYSDPFGVTGAFASGDGSNAVIFCKDEEFYTKAVYIKYEKGEIKELFNRKFGTGYMVSGAFYGNDSLVLSGVSTDSGNLTGSVNFLKKSDGQVYSTQQTDGQVYLKMGTVGGNILYAVSGESVRLMSYAQTASSEGEKNTEIWNRSGGRYKIAAAVSVTSKLFAVALAPDNVTESESSVSQVVIYNKDGEETARVNIDGVATELISEDSCLIVASGTAVTMMDSKGRVVGSADLMGATEGISYVGKKTCVVRCEDALYSVSW